MTVETFRSVAVLGAGTMGAQIAAHFANAGVPALLLDLTSEIARKGLQRARGLKIADGVFRDQPEDDEAQANHEQIEADQGQLELRIDEELAEGTPTLEGLL